MKTNVAILASGSGTTAEAFIRAAAHGEVDANITLVICNNQQAGIFERIKKLNDELSLDIQTAWISGKTHPALTDEVVGRGVQTIAEQQAILDQLHKHQVDLVLLMGYLKKVGPRLIETYGWQPDYTSPYQARMLNTHPGLLPESKGFIGIHVQEYVLKVHLPEAGQTLHVVSEQYDDGPVIAENRVAIEPNDTAETLFDRVQVAEKTHLPSDVEQFIKAQRAYRV